MDNKNNEVDILSGYSMMLLPQCGRFEKDDERGKTVE
jgi:hypothetical protein